MKTRGRGVDKFGVALYAATLTFVVLAAAVLVAAGLHEHREHVTWRGVGPGVHPGVWFIVIITLYLVGVLARLLLRRRG